MLSRRPSRSGFSLIELMITLAVLSLLLLATVPSFGHWVGNQRVRSTAESMQNGLRLALASALQRNRSAAFVLTADTPSLAARPASNARNWYVRLLPLADSDERDGDAESATRYVDGSNFGTQGAVTVSGPALLCFGPLGQQVSLDSDATGLGTACNSASPAVYTVSGSGSDRPLQVQVYLGGRVRLCDPAKTLSNEAPDGC